MPKRTDVTTAFARWPASLRLRAAFSAAVFAAIAARAALFVQSYWIPIYTDEVVWRVAKYRYWQTGLQAYNGMPHCPSRYGKDVPLFMKPMSFVLSGWYAVAYEPWSPIAIRALGHAGFALGCALFALLARKLHPKLSSVRALALALLPSGLCFLPYVAIFNRPEQEFWLASLVLTCAVAYREKLRAYHGALLAAGFVAFGELLLHLHPQNAFLFPIFALAAFFCVRNKAWASAAIAGFLILVASHARWWDEAIACPESKFVEQTIALDKSRIPPFDEILGRLERPFGLALFSEQKPSAWLRAGRMGPAYGAVNALSAIWFLAVMGAAGVGCALCLKKAARDGRGADPLDLAAPALLTVAVGFFLLMPNRNFYRGAVTAQMWFLPLVVAWTRLSGSRSFSRSVVALFAAGGAIGLVSQALLFEHGRDVLDRPGGSALLEAQPYSFDAFDYSATREKTQAAAKSCGWRPEKSYRFVAMDESANFALANVRNPIFATYVADYWRGAGDPIQALKRLGAEGIVMDCRRFAWIPELAPALKQTGGFCCAGFDDAGWLTNASPLRQ